MIRKYIDISFKTKKTYVFYTKYYIIGREDIYLTNKVLSIEEVLDYWLSIEEVLDYWRC